MSDRRRQELVMRKHYGPPLTPEEHDQLDVLQRESCSKLEQELRADLEYLRKLLQTVHQKEAGDGA